MKIPWSASLLIWIVVATTLVGALSAVLSALFPRIVARTRQIAENEPARSVLVGLVNAALLIALGLALGALAPRLPLLRWRPGAVAWLPLAIGVALGITAVSGLVGARIWPDRPLPQQHGLGAWLGSLAALVPFVGWFVLLPYVVALGLGASIIALVQRSAPHD